MIIRVPNPNIRFLKSKPKRPSTKAGGGASSGSRNVLAAPTRLMGYTDITPFPNMAVVKLRFGYRWASSSNAASSLIGSPLVIQANSVYEPVDTLSDQPYGYDQMAALYSKYKVLGVTLQVTSAASATSPSMMFVLGQSPTGGVSLSGANAGLTTSRPNVAVYPCAAAGGPVSTYRRDFAIHELLGVTKQEFDSNVEDYTAAVGANPAQMPTIQLAESTLSSVQSATVSYVSLTFTVQFFGRIGQSLS